MYKNYKIAYLFEIVVGILSIVAIFIVGSKGIVFISIIAIRPMVLERTSISLEGIEKYYSVGKQSLTITFITLLIIYFSSEFLFQINTDWKLITLIIAPYFLLNHGIASLLYKKYKK